MAGDSASRNKVTIKIPRPLYDKIALLIEGAGYNSVTDFVVYVLRDIVASSHDREEEPYGGGVGGCQGAAAPTGVSIGGTLSVPRFDDAGGR